MPGEKNKMRVKVTVPQIRCSNLTHPRTDADEIYLAYYATLAKIEDGKTEVKKHAVKKLSSVKNRVKKGTKWNPSVDCIIDTDSADSIIFNFGLYEADNKKIYKKMQEGSDVLIEPDGYDWGGLEIPVDPSNWMSWLKSIWKLALVSYTYFSQDDLLGTKSFAVAKIEGKDKSWLGTRELKFSRYGGDYRVTICLEEIK